MSVFKFIFSKTFLIQLAIALVLIVAFIFLSLEWLESSTNHGKHIEVPNLSKMSLDRAELLLEDQDLRYSIQDSANYNPDYPRYSIIEQNPKPGSLVKENRKIYLVLNPSGYRKVKIPDVVHKTRRQVEPTLRALGFEIGSVSYQPNIARDMVLELRHKGKTVRPGSSLMKTSKIDLVLGDGTRGGGVESPDTDDDLEEPTDSADDDELDL